MISIEQCKKILLDTGESFTDDEVQKIREYLYQFAKIATLEKEQNE